MALKTHHIIILSTFLLCLACNNRVRDFFILQPQTKPITVRTSANSFQTRQNSDKFGFFSSTLWSDYSANLFKHIGIFGSIPKYVLWYLQMDDPFPDNTVEFNENLGIHTVISHDLKSIRFDDDRNRQLMPEIIAGKWDKYFRTFARRAKKAKVPIYYRFGYEMNGDWFPWCERPEEFVKAWQHVWTIFQKEKVTNISWVFSPSILWDYNNKSIHSIEPYYPGDAYVDIVALDGYNFGDFHTKYHKWKSVEEVFRRSLTILESYHKPIWIAETGCPTDPRRIAWLNELFNLVESHCCIEAFFWFNENKAGEPDFRIQSDSASLMVFRNWLQKKNYQQQEPGQLAQLFSNF